MYSLDKTSLESKLRTNIPNLSDTAVLLRTCLNVTTDKEGNMIDDTRYVESYPLIKELAGKAKSLLITAHLGRPKTHDAQYSFAKLAAKLEKDLGQKVTFITDLEDITKIESGVYFLENVRFFDGEDAKEEDKQVAFAQALTASADVFVNDAFADYRESVSTYVVAKFLPSYLGPVFAKEVTELGRLATPAHPFVAAIGWSKLSEKLDTMMSLLQSADQVLVGGAMAYTFLASQGIATGNSLVEKDKLEVAAEMLRKYASKIVLPVDHALVTEFKDPGVGGAIYGDHIPDGHIAVDIGPETIAQYEQILGTAKTIVRNGPMGVTEWDATSLGTNAIGIATVENKGAYKLSGGGDSVTAIHKLGLKGFDHVSTGGGAMLAFLGYDEFPTLDVILED